MGCPNLFGHIEPHLKSSENKAISHINEADVGRGELLF